MEASQSNNSKQNYSLYKNSKLKNNLRNQPSNVMSQKKTFTQQKQEYTSKFNNVEKTDRYTSMLNEMLMLNKTRGLNLNLACDRSLLDHMHSQTKFSLDTSSDLLNENLQLNLSENINDTFELFYTKNYTITPMLYRIIINMASPDSISGIPLEFYNKKVLIFDYTNIFDGESFEKEFLKPFYFSNVLPQLEKELQNLEDDQEITQETFLDEYLEKVHKNIFIVKYSNLVELYFKIQNIPNLIKKIKEVCLVIVDSPNLLINQSVGLQYESEIVNEETMNLKTTVSFNKKKRKSLNEEEKNMFELINNLLNNFQKEFNVNLIFTVYDFERLENLNFLKYKLSDQNFVFDTRKNMYLINIGNDDKIVFMFQLKDFKEKHKIYSLEPANSYVNFNCNVFAYITYINQNLYKFRAYLKKTEIDQIILLHDIDLHYSKPIH